MPAAEDVPKNLDSDLSYFFGYSFGNMLKEGGNNEVDLERLAQGIKDSLAEKAPELTQSQQEAVIELVKKRRSDLQSRQGLAMLVQGQEFLAVNAGKEGVKRTASGLQYKVIEEGTGAKPTVDNTVVVHYEGQLINGQIFDSSRQRGQPAEFGLGQVIRGWTEGLQLMKEGGKTRLFIPSELGYGPGGTGNIPANAVLIFDVELIEIK
ncbi:MAG TPA: FKBP-type peptidyl-prolyl cis-trans isomerase [Pseudomonadales bacterium]|nr:FKBP-type peptidyl-prolyl cis-trans isomerase [Pseudomonadales bacterium]MDP6315850.1 FKBP-type peptidyl-prolyl cis-trans isomerase [Pseudomonadales bacterium]MDP7313996.1 FKBP-type peptidyl-prolyl cis-trans isomerase [Pseudomonadales bacterium]HJP52851.1 FKBP-type peptidyl-prolyl cis-trans isomerase [Pseudomonadales bacterium]